MPQLAPSVLMKSMPITMLSLDDLMSNKATLTGGAVAAAAQLAHAAHSSSSISENRQVCVYGCTFLAVVRILLIFFIVAVCFASERVEDRPFASQ